RRQGLDDETKTSDFPVEGELFLLTSPFIERSIPKTNWPWPPPGHTTTGAVQTGECNHEMPGLPYPAFRRVNAEPGGGKPSPYGERPCATLSSQVLMLARFKARPRLGRGRQGALPRSASL